MNNSKRPLSHLNIFWYGGGAYILKNVVTHEYLPLLTAGTLHCSEIVSSGRIGVRLFYSLGTY